MQPSTLVITSSHTLLAATLGTSATIGLAHDEMPFRRFITAAGMYF